MRGGGAIGATRITASAGRGIKEPTILQSFSPNPFFLGNPDLLPEESETWELGLSQRQGDWNWQLVAFEWVFPKKPAKAPLPGATYGSFGAACHFKDGTFVSQASQESCATKSPQTGSAFNFWHPDLVTLHVWAWYPNPSGVFSGMNPLMRPFNGG